MSQIKALLTWGKYNLPMPYDSWVASPPSYHETWAWIRKRVAYLLYICFKKIALLELSSLLIIHYIKKSPYWYKIHTASRKKIHLNTFNSSSKKYRKPWAMADWTEIFRVSFTEKSKRQIQVENFTTRNREHLVTWYKFTFAVCRKRDSWLQKGA